MRVKSSEPNNYFTEEWLKDIKKGGVQVVTSPPEIAKQSDPLSEPLADKVRPSN